MPVTVPDDRRTVWLLVADGLVQGCPPPEALDLTSRDSALSVVLRVSGVADVACWARFLGLPGPRALTYLTTRGTLLVTATYTHGPLACLGDGTGVEICHSASAPAVTPAPAPGVTAADVERPGDVDRPDAAGSDAAAGSADAGRRGDGAVGGGGRG